MIRAYSIADVRAAEDEVRAALDEGELMQRAALGLGQVAWARLTEGDRVVVLAGSGDNGGDALYAAAHLAEAGSNVVAVLVGSRTHEAGLRTAEAEGVIALEWRGGEPAADVTAALSEADLVIDGIVGIGATPGLPEHLRGLNELIGADAYVLAVDLPSGVDPAGRVSAPSLFADETVTFSLLKPCHLLPEGELACGQLTVVDIGVPEPEVPAVVRYEAADVARLWPVPTAYDDKYSRGVLGLVTGSETYPGAAVLGSVAAVTAGVGMLRYVGPGNATDLVLAAAPEVVPGPGRVQAWALGSGWDGRGGAPGLVDEIFESDLPVLLDAGALELIDEPRSGPTLLTPHAGELSRLAERIGCSQESGVDAAQQVADLLDATVLLKGAVTVIVPPRSSGRPVITQADGSPWLATAGSGDVLAGIVGALLAGGLPVDEAAAAGALVHGTTARDVGAGGPVRSVDVAHRCGETVRRLLQG